MIIMIVVVMVMRMIEDDVGILWMVMRVAFVVKMVTTVTTVMVRMVNKNLFYFLHNSERRKEGFVSHVVMMQMLLLIHCDVVSKKTGYSSFCN